MEYGAKYNRSGFGRLAFGLHGGKTAVSAFVQASAKVTTSGTAKAAQRVSVTVGLKPGQVLELDSERMEIRINGQTLFSGYSGIGLLMQPHTTSLYYTDNANDRNLEATVVYTDHYY